MDMCTSSCTYVCMYVSIYECWASWDGGFPPCSAHVEVHFPNLGSSVGTGVLLASMGGSCETSME